MNKKSLLRRLLPLALIAVMTMGLSACGTMRTHWGVEHEYNYDFDNGRPDRHHHKPPKPPKKKKHKKNKKHHDRHDHDCRWDD